MSREQLITAFIEGMASMQRGLAKLKPSMPLHETPTKAQFFLMVVLGREGAQGVKDLAERLCMSSSAVTQLVDQLADERFVTRKEDDNDRRRILVSLTEKGKRALIEGTKVRLARTRAMLKGLTDAELKQLAVLQQKIIHSLEQSA